MDGHFNHIPNKIRCKDSVSIDITGDLDTPLVGLLSFTLTVDPRYAHQQKNGQYAFSPYVSSNNQTSQFPHVPPWIIGPGGLPYIPPSVTRLYELQHSYIQKLNDIQQKRAQKMEQREKRRMQRAEIKQQRMLKRKGRKARKQENMDEEEKEAMNGNVASKNADDELSDSVVEKDSDSDFESESYSTGTEEEEDLSEDGDGNEIEIEEPPKYKLIILWSIIAQQRDNRYGTFVSIRERMFF